MTVVARDLKNNDTTDAGFDLLTDPTTIGAVTGDAGITRILFGSTGVDGGFAQGSATDGMLVNLGSNNDVTVTGTVTVDTELPASAALADNAANPTTVLVGSCLLAFDGSTWDRVTNGGGVEATALRVTIASDSTGVLSVDDNGGSLTVDGTVTANAGTGTFTTDQANAAEADYDTGAGTVNQVMFGIALPGSGGPVAGGTATNPVRTDPTGTTTQPVSGTVAATQSGGWTVSVSGTVTVDSELPAAGALADNAANPTTVLVGACLLGFDGTAWDRVTNGGGVEATALRVTIANDSTGVVSVDDNGGSLTVDGTVAATQSGTWTVQPGNTANTTAWLVADRAETTGGLSISRDLDADETETEAKASAGQLYGYYFANTHASSWRYLKFYNATAADVIVGTTTPVLTLGLPAASAGHVEFSKGIAFSTAICYAVTTAVADNDIGAPGVNECVVNVFYK